MSYKHEVKMSFAVTEWQVLLIFWGEKKDKNSGKLLFLQIQQGAWMLSFKQPPLSTSSTHCAPSFQLCAMPE